MKKTVLITGAGGLIGTLLRKALADTYTFRLLSLQPIPDAEAYIADISDLSALQEAAKGVDSIIHLAASAAINAPWDAVLHNNIIGTYNVFEAAAQCGVKQVIFASTNHTMASYEALYPEIYQTGLPVLDHQMPSRPDSLYGVSKSFGEVLGQYYVDHRGLHVLCVRIGFINSMDTPYPVASREPGARLAALWLSHRDAVQLFDKGLRADEVPYSIIYGISNNRPHYYDLEQARTVIDYQPQDGADVAQVP